MHIMHIDSSHTSPPASSIATHDRTHPAVTDSIINPAMTQIILRFAFAHGEGDRFEFVLFQVEETEDAIARDTDDGGVGGTVGTLDGEMIHHMTRQRIVCHHCIIMLCQSFHIHWHAPPFLSPSLT